MLENVVFSGSGFDSTTKMEMDVKIEQVSTFPASEASAFMIYEALNKTLENAVSIKEYYFPSFLVEGILNHDLILKEGKALG